MCNRTTTLNIQITTPHVGEWKEFRALRLEALKNEPQAFKNRFQDEAQFTSHDWKKKISNSSGNSPDEFFIIAKDNDQMVGMVGARYDTNKIWKVQSVYVRATYRGRGIGAALLEAVVGKLEHTHHAKNIELIVNTTQHTAIHTYLKCGFVVKEVLENQESGDGKCYTKFVMCWVREEKILSRKLRATFVLTLNELPQSI